VSLSLALLAVLAGVVTAAAVTVRQLVDRLRTLERQAITDALTGAFNRRYFNDCLRTAIERHTRFGEPACLMLLDLDRFKEINDRLGHLAGDAVLKGLVILVRGRLRTLDLLFRTGGEEFALLLPSTSFHGAIEVAEQLRALVDAWRPIDGPTISISLGVSELRRGQSALDWIDETDRALYRAKRAGRNRVAGAAPKGARVTLLDASAGRSRRARS
jgi:diguanylate cyclase (GGDEF)-like protein